jgi:hypothetical protein
MKRFQHFNYINVVGLLADATKKQMLVSLGQVHHFMLELAELQIHYHLNYKVQNYL